MTDAFLYDERTYERDRLISEYETAKMSGGDGEAEANRLRDEFGYDVHEDNREDRRHFADPTAVDRVSPVEAGRAAVDDATESERLEGHRYGAPAVDPWLTAGDATERPPVPPVRRETDEEREAREARESRADR